MPTSAVLRPMGVFCSLLTTDTSVLYFIVKFVFYGLKKKKLNKKNLGGGVGVGGGNMSVNGQYGIVDMWEEIARYRREMVRVEGGRGM